jgi:hypothetical protein
MCFRSTCRRITAAATGQWRSHDQRCMTTVGHQCGSTTLTLCLHARAGMHAQLVCANDHLSALSMCRLAQLKRKWPFDPRPDRMASAVKHARRGAGTQDELLRSGAAESDGDKAEANPVLPDLAQGAAHAAVSAPPPAPAAAAAAVDERDATSAGAVQRPHKRIRRTPTGVCRVWSHAYSSCHAEQWLADAPAMQQQHASVL